MKILFTGMQHRQTSEDIYVVRGRSKDYTPTERYIIKGLRLLGHEVDVRRIEVGDRTIRSDYDLAFIGLSGYHQLSTMDRRFNALWVASQMPAVYFLGDWQLVESFRSLRRPSVLWSHPGDDPKNEMIRTSEIHAAAEKVSKLGKIYLPMHSWGSAPPEFLKKLRIKQLFSSDLSALTMDEIDTGVNYRVERVKQWLYFTLNQNQGTIDLLEEAQAGPWPIVGCYTKKMPYIPEAEMLEMCRMSAGALTPTRNVTVGHEIFGLWRLRNLHYAATGVVIAGDPESYPYPENFPGLREIEAMSDDQRTELAQRQRASILTGMGSIDDELNQLNNVLKNAVVPA